MIGLIKKDLLLILKNISIAYIFGILVPLFVVLQNPQFFMIIITLIISLMFAMQITTTMSLDENVKWRKNVTAMPITIFQESLSKYILTFLLASLSSLIVFVLVSIIGGVFLELNIYTIAVYTFLCFTIVILYNAIVIPVSFKYGTSKGRYFIMAFMAIPISIPYLLKIFDLHISIEKVITNVNSLLFLGFAVVLIILIVSLFLSVKILKGSEGAKVFI